MAVELKRTWPLADPDRTSPDLTSSERTLEEVRQIRRSIFGLLLAVFFLLGIGLIAVYSAAVNLPTRAEGTFNNNSLIAQAIRVLLCVLVLFSGARLPISWLRKHYVSAFGAAVLLLSLVWVPGLGESLLGARRWVEVAGVSFQPSELAKLCFVVYLAAFLARYDAERALGFRDIAPAVVALTLMVVLIMSEPDLGTTLIVVGVSFTLFVIAGVRPYRLLIAASVLAAGIGWYAREALSYVAHRFEMFWNPPPNTQVWHSLHAIGSGGIFGRGLGGGLQKLHFIPQSTSDFIVAVIGEEGGFFALTLVLALYASLVICGVHLVIRFQDRFAQLLGVGILLFLSLGAVVNIAVATAMAPAKGLPLPFVSAGGSAMIVGGLAVGVLLALSRHEILCRVTEAQDSNLEPRAS